VEIILHFADFFLQGKWQKWLKILERGREKSTGISQIEAHQG
jgi:hypothetical protein